MCAVLTAPITPLRSQHTQLLRHNQPSRYSTSHTFPTKDAPLLMKHLLMIVPCTPDSHATVPSALSQNLDKEIWSGIRTNSAWSQPAFKHCQQHHLLFCVWVFCRGWLLVVSYLSWVCVALHYQNKGNISTTGALRSN